MQSKPNRAEKLETIRQTIEHMSDQELDVLFGKVHPRVWHPEPVFTVICGYRQSGKTETLFSMLLSECTQRPDLHYFIVSKDNVWSTMWDRKIPLWSSPVLPDIQFISEEVFQAVLNHEFGSDIFPTDKGDVRLYVDLDTEEFTRQLIHHTIFLKNIRCTVLYDHQKQETLEMYHKHNIPMLRVNLTFTPGRA